jgi:hypothetical protein
MQSKAKIQSISTIRENLNKLKAKITELEDNDEALDFESTKHVNRSKKKQSEVIKNQLESISSSENRNYINSKHLSRNELYEINEKLRKSIKEMPLKFIKINNEKLIQLKTELQLKSELEMKKLKSKIKNQRETIEDLKNKLEMKRSKIKDLKKQVVLINKGETLSKKQLKANDDASGQIRLLENELKRKTNQIDDLKQLVFEKEVENEKCREETRRAKVSLEAEKTKVAISQQTRQSVSEIEEQVIQLNVYLKASNRNIGSREEIGTSKLQDSK